MHRLITSLLPLLLFYSFGLIICSKFDIYIAFKLASNENAPRAIARVPAKYPGWGTKSPSSQHLGRVWEQSPEILTLGSAIGGAEVHLRSKELRGGNRFSIVQGNFRDLDAPWTAAGVAIKISRVIICSNESRCLSLKRIKKQNLYFGFLIGP